MTGESLATMTLSSEILGSSLPSRGSVVVASSCVRSEGVVPDPRPVQGCGLNVSK